MKSLDTKKLAQALLDTTLEQSDSKKAVSDFAQYLKKTGNLKHADKIISEYNILYNKKHNIMKAKNRMRFPIQFHNFNRTFNLGERK